MCSFGYSSLAFLMIATAASPVVATERPQPSAGTGVTAEDVEKLRKEIADLRQLIVDTHAMEQQHYEFLLKLLRSGQNVPPTEVQDNASASASAADSARTVAAKPRAMMVSTTTSLSGKVRVNGGSRGEIYVYIDDVRTPPARGKSVTITQKGKAFVPSVAVVQRGTKVQFPNTDTVFHNVFSPSPTQPFDLGTYRAGDAARSVVFTNPGVAEIYCNIHSKMRSSVLVVPNPLFVKVKADGTYRIDGVPLGKHRVVAWAPDAKPSLGEIELSSVGGKLDLVLESQAPRAHNNKLGQPYGSYGD